MAERGEEVELRRGKTPVARLVPVTHRDARRQPGAFAGQIEIAEDFDAWPAASLGKLEAPAGWVEELLAEGFELLAVSPAHAGRLRALPHVSLAGRPHRDPFDRLLVAQAQVEGVPLVTLDPAVTAHGLPTIW